MADIERPRCANGVRRCFVLGAGFSKACDLPLASELTRLIFEDAFPEGDDFLSPIRDTYLNWLKRLYPALGLEHDWPDFEDLITVLDEWESYSKSYEGTELSTTAGTAAHLKSVLLKHLGTSLCELTASASQTSKNLIVEFLREVQRSSAAIVSFNWDLVLECAAHDAGIAVKDDNAKAPGVLLVKPHGSLDLAELDGNEYDRLAATSSNILNLTVMRRDARMVVVRANDPSDAANRILHPFAESQRLLVEPTARKVYSSGWIDLQWRLALNALRNADEIVVIGYSLPDTDFRPRILFQLASWNAQRQPRMMLIDPRAERVVARYQRWVSVPIEPVESAWSEWFAGEQERQPAEQASGEAAVGTAPSGKPAVGAGSKEEQAAPATGRETPSSSSGSPSPPL